MTRLLATILLALIVGYVYLVRAAWAPLVITVGDPYSEPFGHRVG